jgi:Histidine kinase-, DNA gyrase B-, and HSP90-like ATPase
MPKLSSTTTPKPESLDPSNLRLRVAPHVVEDLGLNLYTSLARVLVEYVANAYDADSRAATITMNWKQIQREAVRLKALDKAQKENAKASGRKPTRTHAVAMKDSVAIVIEDSGAGMSCDELHQKFLVAGRRRRGADNTQWRSPSGRPLMGRKGLGKLAGFGVAQSVRVTTRTKDASHATQVELRYQEIARAVELDEIPVHGRSIRGGAGLPRTGGTRVELRQLLFEPMSVAFEELANSIAKHFSLINPKEFRIRLCGKPLPTVQRDLEWGWPNPELPVDALVEASYDAEGERFPFQYRLRFKSRGKALPAEERGVRVYAHNRLVAPPSLFRTDTNIHGFHMSDYLDGVVHADFLDEQPSDYVATNRQGLRWESPLLAPLRDFLSSAIKVAVKERYKVFEEDSRKKADADQFTTDLLAHSELTRSETTVARHIAAMLATRASGGVNDDEYRSKLTEVVGGLGRGRLFTTLKELASEEEPEMEKVVAAVSKLTAEQLDSFYRFVRGRVHGVEALRKIVEDRSFAREAKKNERALHDLLAQNPWLIEPGYFQYVTSNKSEATTFHELEKVLKIGKFIPKNYDAESPNERLPDRTNLRPDLVFIVGSIPISHIVVVELKAPNVPLVGEHFRQLQGYVYDVEEWLKENDTQARVTGVLVGSMEKPSKREKLSDRRWLEKEVMQNDQFRKQYQIKTIPRLLDDARNANHDVLKSWDQGNSLVSEGAADELGDRTSKRERDGVPNLPSDLRRKPVKIKRIRKPLKTRRLAK